MSKLHELLAVEGDLEGTFKNILEETVVQFTKHPERYWGQNQRMEPLFEDVIKEADVHKKMDDTVADKLEYSEGHIVRYLDAVLQKEATNQVAKADLVIDGKVLASNVPATFLLGLETRLKHVRRMFESIPTLQPGIAWELDETQGKNIYKMVHPEEKFKTKKVTKNHIKYEATKEHPAQVETYTEDEKIARIITDRWCGMITPARKSELLGRFDKLLRAVKQARQTANSAEVVKSEIGKSLFEYITG